MSDGKRDAARARPESPLAPRRPAGRGFPWSASVAVAALLVGGGAAAMVASGYSGDASAASQTGGGQSGGGQSGMRLDALDSAMLHASGHGAAACRHSLCRRRVARLRPLLRGIHGQITFESARGPRTLAFERGTVGSVTPSAVTVTATDGTTWTWHLARDTVLRRAGRRVNAASLARGERVFAGGPLIGGADDARIIVIAPASAP
jgi:hypothetical protein